MSIFGIHASGSGPWLDRAAWMGWGRVRVGFWFAVSPGRPWWHFSRGCFGFLHVRLWRFDLTVRPADEPAAPPAAKGPGQ